MQVSRKTKRQLRLQNSLFLLLFLALLGLLAYLSTSYVYQADWTAGSRNSLTADSEQLLARLQGPVRIEAYATEDAALRTRLRDLIARYQRVDPQIELEFVNPDLAPDRVRRNAITYDGELLVHYQGRSEKVADASESTLSNALLRLAAGGGVVIGYLAGHGDRDLRGEANYDLGRFGEELERRGFDLREVNLAAEPEVPTELQLLVIAGPQQALLPGEVASLERYLAAGGNLLWLTEPGGWAGLDAIAARLGLRQHAGVVVDTTTQILGIADPTYAVVVDYPPHPATRGLSAISVFPQAAALDWAAPTPAGAEADTDDPAADPAGGEEDWQAQPLLNTVERAWTETAAIEGEIAYDADLGEQLGPLDLGHALTRPRPPAASGEDRGEQRLVVLGDGDFLANAFLGNGANLELGINLVQWLVEQDEFMSIVVESAPDTRLELSPTAQVVIAVGFLFVLPPGLILAGVFIWWRRRRR